MRFWVAVALLLAAGPGAVAGEDAWQLLDEFRRHLRAESPLRASFTQTFVPAGFSTGEKESGRMALALPDCLRWDYDEPYAKSFLLCGDVFHYWNPGEDEGHIEEIEAEREPGLDLLLLEVSQLQERYEAELVAGERRMREIRLRPREANDYVAEAALVLDRGLERLLFLRYVDPEGSVTEFAISGWKKGAENGTFNPPEGVEWLEEW
ncbi:MAG: outer membrane lipoprotein carrier protein LolA [Thermoanaerobaculia bacterium]|nr:outer membrane lipoprotein carrier protein LolA [Thermoanaerobaculia bacterium]